MLAVWHLPKQALENKYLPNIIYCVSQQMNNIILGKRRDIIENNNTAQSQLESILDRLSRNTNVDLLDFNEPFHGSLDFSLLSEMGFRNVKTLVFGSEGEITSISNLPNTLEKLHISNQYLVEINDLPKNLVELDVHDNYLTVLDVHHLPKLKLLNASNNKLEKLEKLPETLEELYIDNNEISQLILKDNLVLRILHCSNNKTILIDGLPPSLVDFQCENNPYIQQNNFLDIHGNRSGDEERRLENASQRMDYYEALNEYFKLKNKYETEYKKDRQKAFMTAKTRGVGKQGRANRVAGVLPKCVSCKRQVGSIFKVKDSHYIAMCGDVQSPCPFKIDLYRGAFWTTQNTVASLSDVILDIKETVITTKLSSIFKYKTEKDAIEKFNELMEEYNDFNQFYNEVKTTYDKQFRDPVREQLYKRKLEQVYKLIAAIKLIMKQYEEEGNTILLQTAVRMQIEELNPEIENLRRLKYEVMEMNGNVLTQMYSSIQNASFSNKEPRVIRWSV